MKINYDEAYWVRKFQEQEELIRHNLPNENYKHCLDKDHFGMRYYNPIWVVTNEAHVWSLQYKRLLSPNQDMGGTRSKDGEYSQSRYYFKNSCPDAVKKVGVKKEIKVFVHQLVANYFCDRMPVNLYGEDACVVHHIFGYDEGADCTWLNRANHIQYVRKIEHKLLNALQNGITQENFEKYGLVDSQVMRALVSNAAFEYQGYKLNNGVKVTYNADGSRRLSTVIPINGGKRAWL